MPTERTYFGAMLVETKNFLRLMEPKKENVAIIPLLPISELYAIHFYKLTPLT